MSKGQNTHNQGQVTIFMYPQSSKYIGVCLELDLIDEDQEIEALKVRMKERVISYIKYIAGQKKNEGLLNRRAPLEYWRKFYAYVHTLQSLGKATRLNHGQQPTEAAIESLSLRDYIPV